MRVTARTLLFAIAMINLSRIFTILDFTKESDVIQLADFSPKREIAAIFVTHSRPHYLEKAIRGLLSQHHSEKVDVYVSLDKASNAKITKAHLQSIDHDFPGQIRQLVLFYRSRHYWSSHQKIDEHVMFALNYVSSLQYKHIIFNEEDAVPSPDMLDLYLSSSTLLETDNSLFCVSAWNDNSFPRIARDVSKLHRTSSIPNLGFFMLSSTAELVTSRWEGFIEHTWDDWIRRAAGMRECIVPEISRLKHIGNDGVHISDNSYYDEMVVSVVPGNLNTFKDQIQIVGDAEIYEAKIDAELASAIIVKYEEFVKPGFSTKRGPSYLVLVEKFRVPEFGTKYGIHLIDSLRINHRGLIELHDYDSDIKIFLANSQTGTRWIPRENWTPIPSDITMEISEPGNNCHETCQNENKECAAQFFHQLNDCENLTKFVRCSVCSARTSGSSERGITIINPTDNIFSSLIHSDHCTLGNNQGFYCDYVSQEHMLCPCK